MERLISKKLRVDQHNDSLLEEPIMKKFIGVSRRISVDVQPIQNKFNFKLIQPEVEPSKITIRKRIISQSPSSSRISFFTKYNQARLPDSVSARHWKSLSETVKSRVTNQSSRLILKSLNIHPKINFIQKKLSVGTLKPKAEVQRIALLRRKNIADNPFRESWLESDYI